MKKFLISIFAIFYLGLSCGFAFNMHFCMGRFSSVELFHTGKNTCTKCGMKNRQGCCDSKLTVVKITDSQQLSSAELNIHSPLIAVINYHTYLSVNSAVHPANTIFTATSPPVNGAFLCILNSIFII